MPVPLPSRLRGESTHNNGEEEEEEESDYGELVDGTGTHIDVRMLDEEARRRLEETLDGVGSDEEVCAGGYGGVDGSSSARRATRGRAGRPTRRMSAEEGEEDGGSGSDSSIDVQTPLP